MAVIKVSDIIEATGGELLAGDRGEFAGISTDSRNIKGDEIFFALRGDKFDGHDYLTSALEKGGGATVDKRPGELTEGKVIICVNDTLRSLQDLAHFIRNRRDIPVVAVTGSNGKTTTKEMIHLILSSKYSALKNEGNLNNLIGLPLSLLKLDTDHEIIVLEMGMNALGEIRRLCEIAAPTHGVVTNIGSAHVGMLGGYEAVRDAKLEILPGLSVAVVNGDDTFLMEGVGKAEGFKGQLITFGIHNESHVMAKNIRNTVDGSEFMLDVGGQGSIPVNLKVYGYFNIYNALAATAVCDALGMDINDIKNALEKYRAFSMRFEVIRKGDITVINDSYNANPSSVIESISELVRLSGRGRSVVILGDMRELGEFSETEHRDIGKVVTKTGVDIFIAVGARMSLAAEECFNGENYKEIREVFVFRDSAEAGENIMNILKAGDTVLVKGSRSMMMEKVVEGIPGVV